MQADINQFCFTITIQENETDHVFKSPHVHLVANLTPPPPNAETILFLNKNISPIKEYYINIYMKVLRECYMYT